MIKNSGDESGYSLVEVLAAITILMIAILPMFKMFDVGLRVAENGSDYDRARTFVNSTLERAKSIPYDDLADRFPGSALLVTPNDGGTISSTTTDADGLTGSADAEGPYPGLTYAVSKQFVDLPSSGGNELNASDDEDEGLIKIIVTACWNDVDSICGNRNGNEYNATTVVSR